MSSLSGAVPFVACMLMMVAMMWFMLRPRGR